MANTKRDILDDLTAALAATSGINAASRVLLEPTEARASAPYVGVRSAGEIVLVEDSTHIRYQAQVDLLLVQRDGTIEELIDVVRDAMLNGMATTIGAKEVRLLGVSEVSVVNTNDFGSARVQFQIIYASTKGSA